MRNYQSLWQLGCCEKNLLLMPEGVGKIIDSLTDIVIIKNTDHSIIEMNQAGYDFFSLEEDVTGKSCYQISESLADCCCCVTRKSLKKRKKVTVERYLSDNDVFFQISSNPIVNKKGEIIFIVEQLKDLTSLKKLKKESRQDNQKKQARINQLLKELAIAERMDNLSELTPIMAHEMGNWLSSIKAKAELGVLEEDKEKINDFFININQDVDSMINYLKHLLQIGKSTTGKKVLKKVEDILSDLFVVIKPMIIVNEISFSKKIESDLPLIKANRVALMQALINLFKHAIEATPAGGTISIEIKTLNDEQIQFIISDPGKGIPDEIQDKVFDKYFTTGGTGIGLALVKKVIEDHQGEIHFTSRKNKGTTFYINLPVSSSQ